MGSPQHNEETTQKKTNSSENYLPQFVYIAMSFQVLMPPSLGRWLQHTARSHRLSEAEFDQGDNAELWLFWTGTPIAKGDPSS